MRYALRARQRKGTTFVLLTCLSLVMLASSIALLSSRHGTRALASHERVLASRIIEEVAQSAAAEAADSFRQQIVGGRALDEDFEPIEVPLTQGMANQQWPELMLTIADVRLAVVDVTTDDSALTTGCLRLHVVVSSQCGDRQGWSSYGFWLNRNFGRPAEISFSRARQTGYGD